MTQTQAAPASFSRQFCRCPHLWGKERRRRKETAFFPVRPSHRRQQQQQKTLAEADEHLKIGWKKHLHSYVKENVFHASKPLFLKKLALGQKYGEQLFGESHP